MRHDSVRDPRDCLGIEGNLIVVWLFLSIVLFLLPAEFGMAPSTLKHRAAAAS